MEMRITLHSSRLGTGVSSMGTSSSEPSPDRLAQISVERSRECPGRKVCSSVVCFRLRSAIRMLIIIRLVKTEWSTHCNLGSVNQILCLVFELTPAVDSEKRASGWLAENERCDEWFTRW
jgi:hypothetical protein